MVLGGASPTEPMHQATMAMAVLPKQGILTEPNQPFCAVFDRAQPQHPVGTDALDLSFSLDAGNALLVGARWWRHHWQDTSAHDGHGSVRPITSTEGLAA